MGNRSLKDTKPKTERKKKAVFEQVNISEILYTFILLSINFS